MNEKILAAKPYSTFKGMLHWTVFFLLLAMLAVIGVRAGQIYLKDTNLTIDVQDNANVAPGKQIVVHFSSYMLKESVEKGLKVTPAIAYTSGWSGGKDFVITPQEPLQPETEYKVTLSNAKTQWLITQNDISFGLKGPEPPTLLDISPKNNQTEVESMQTIKMEFDKPIGKEYTAEVMIDPLTGFNYLLDETGNQLSIVPTQKLSDGTSYKVEVSLKHNQFPQYKKQVYAGNFITKKPAVVTYTTDANGEPIKTEVKKEEVTAAITEGRYIDIDLSSQTLRLFEDAAEKAAYKVSTGKKGMNTPEGTFKVMGKSKRPWSNKYKLYMPWFIQFTNLGHGIHELPEWPGGYKEGANHLGTPVSHGCVRLGVGPAKRVYDFAEMNLPIVIHQ